VSTPVLDQRATESHDVTIVRAIDAQRILDHADHAERPYAAWAKRAGRRSVVSFDELDDVTLTNIAGPTFAVGRSSRPPPPADVDEMPSASVSGEVRAHFASGAVALLILLIACAALARVAGSEAESGPPRVSTVAH
jgi:hypothetical protein